MRRAGVWGAAFALAVGLPGRARADLEDDARTLVQSFARSGHARRLPPRFAEKGSVRPLLLPSALVSPLGEDCVTVVVLGAPSSTFLLRFLPATAALSWPSGEHPEVSLAGAAQLVRCGARKAMLARLAVEMRSPRGALEVVVARGERPFPPLTRVLAGRSPGALAPPGVAGARARPEPLEARVRGHVERARHAGATGFARRDLEVDDEGRARFRFELDPGCHRLRVLGADADEAGGDLDAELTLGPSPEPVASDRSEAPDATLRACVAEPTVATLRVEGGRPKGAATLLDERYPLPAALPARFAPTERARLAEALWRERAAVAPDSLVASARGVTGVTLLPLELEPHACYVAAVAVVRGRSGGVALSAELAGRQAQNHSGADATGTSLALCAESDGRARLTVEARGEALGWLLTLFRAGRAGPGGPGE